MKVISQTIQFGGFILPDCTKQDYNHVGICKEYAVFVLVFSKRNEI